MNAQSPTATQARDALTESVCETIEGLAFGEVSVHSESVNGITDHHGAIISLGELGRLELAILPEALLQVTATMHGIDESQLDDAVLRDSVLEIANVIAGRFCAQLVGVTGTISLGLPKATSTWTDTHPDAKSIRCDFDIDGRFAMCCRYFPA